MSKRECGTCTKCCEGYLVGEALGHNFYQGKPCHFLSIGKGCTVYAKRPQDPCVVFKCSWLSNADIPEWMKPSDIDTILSEREFKGVKYLQAVEAGSVLDSKVLTWLIEYALSNSINLLWTVEGGAHWVGKPDFNSLMTEKYFPKDQ